jgi:hypothetical protein
MKVPTGYKDSKDLLTQMANYFKDDSPSIVTDKIVNDTTWYTFNLENGFGKTYYYATTKNDKVFLVQYDINEDTDENCDTYREDIINSIKSN